MADYTDSEILAKAAEIKEILGMESETGTEDVQEAKPVAAKSKCKVCGFHKKSRRVVDGVCKSCRTALDSDDLAYGENPEVEVIGRMGKRGRNNVSVMIDGKRWKIKRLSSRHSERVAAKYASKSKGYAKKPAHKSAPPKGLPTSSRLPGDERA